MENPIIDVMMQHKTIRRFDTEFEIPREHIDLIIKAGQQASTSCSGQMYTIIEIPRGKRELLCGKQKFIEQASFFGIICVDAYRLHRIVQQAGAENPIWPLTAFSVGIFDAGLFSQNLALAAESLGYGIAFCGTCGDRSADIIEQLKLPEFVMPLTGIAIGRSVESPPVRPRIRPEMVHHQGSYHDYSTEELEENIEYMSEKLTKEGYYSKYSDRKNYSWREHMQNKFGGKWLEEVEEARVRSLSRQKFLM